MFISSYNSTKKKKRRTVTIVQFVAGSLANTSQFCHMLEWGGRSFYWVPSNPKRSLDWTRVEQILKQKKKRCSPISNPTTTSLSLFAEASGQSNGIDSIVRHKIVPYFLVREARCQIHLAGKDPPSNIRNNFISHPFFVLRRGSTWIWKATFPFIIPQRVLHVYKFKLNDFFV